MNKVEFTISSELNNIPQIEIFIDYLMSVFQIEEKHRGRITLSTIEAVTNAILFGNKRDSQKKVKVIATKTVKTIMITVEDEGIGFDYRQIPDPTVPQRCMQAVKKGLYLMLNLTDKLSFTKHGAKVIMTFLLH